ncbi:MAG: 16S rRNA (guanine(527)-N(7))-methyltransferase RsmG [bacterium]|nr:16S rRNA (guanine(527)-N(7))-methyltransferase RsmG [bacterium]
MVSAEIIYQYFPNLSEHQKAQFEKLYPLYEAWNAKINVISRKDIEELYIHHVLHALSIAKLVNFKNVHSILDIGTGGGFPGIPLAILFPDIQFHLVDSIGKKITVVQAVADDLGLTNVNAEQARAEQIVGKYDIVMCRAVTQLIEFYGWIAKNLKPDSEVVCLKGGDLHDEIQIFKSAFRNKKVKEYFISSLFEHPFFETKKLVLVR